MKKVSRPRSSPLPFPLHKPHHSLKATRAHQRPKKTTISTPPEDAPSVDGVPTFLAQDVPISHLLKHLGPAEYCPVLTPGVEDETNQKNGKQRQPEEEEDRGLEQIDSPCVTTPALHRRFPEHVVSSGAGNLELSSHQFEKHAQTANNNNAHDDEKPKPARPFKVKRRPASAGACMSRNVMHSTAPKGSGGNEMSHNYKAASWSARREYTVGVVPNANDPPVPRNNPQPPKQSSSPPPSKAHHHLIPAMAVMRPAVKLDDQGLFHQQISGLALAQQQYHLQQPSATTTLFVQEGARAAGASAGTGAVAGASFGAGAGAKGGMLTRVAGAAPLTAPVGSTKPMPLVVHSGIGGSMIAAPRRVHKARAAIAKQKLQHEQLEKKRQQGEEAHALLLHSAKERQNQGGHLRASLLSNNNNNHAGGGGGIGGLGFLGGATTTVSVVAEETASRAEESKEDSTATRGGVGGGGNDNESRVSSKGSLTVILPVFPEGGGSFALDSKGASTSVSKFFVHPSVVMAGGGAGCGADDSGDGVGVGGGRGEASLDEEGVSIPGSPSSESDHAAHLKESLLRSYGWSGDGAGGGGGEGGGFGVDDDDDVLSPVTVVEEGEEEHGVRLPPPPGGGGKHGGGLRSGGDDNDNNNKGAHQGQQMHQQQKQQQQQQRQQKHERQREFYENQDWALVGTRLLDGDGDDNDKKESEVDEEARDRKQHQQHQQQHQHQHQPMRVRPQSAPADSMRLRARQRLAEARYLDSQIHGLGNSGGGGGDRHRPHSAQHQPPPAAIASPTSPSLKVHWGAGEDVGHRRGHSAGGNGHSHGRSGGGGSGGGGVSGGQAADNSRRRGGGGQQAPIGATGFYGPAGAGPAGRFVAKANEAVRLMEVRVAQLHDSGPRPSGSIRRSARDGFKKGEPLTHEMAKGLAGTVATGRHQQEGDTEGDGGGGGGCASGSGCGGGGKKGRSAEVDQSAVARESRGPLFTSSSPLEAKQGRPLTPEKPRTRSAGLTKRPASASAAGRRKTSTPAGTSTFEFQSTGEPYLNYLRQKKQTIK